MDKDNSSGIISTLISQPKYILDILNIDKTELKYLASSAAIVRNSLVNVTRLFDILYYHHLIFGSSTDSYSVLEELTNRIQTGLNQKTFSCDRIWPKIRYIAGTQTITDDKRKGSTWQYMLIYILTKDKMKVNPRRTDEEKENDLHSVINKLQSAKLNDLRDRNSTDERRKKTNWGNPCKIGNNVTSTRLSEVADEMEEAKFNQMKKTKSNPDITPCFKCGNRAQYSAECGCRLHSGLVSKFGLSQT